MSQPKRPLTWCRHVSVAELICCSARCAHQSWRRYAVEGALYPVRLHVWGVVGVGVGAGGIERIERYALLPWGKPIKKGDVIKVAKKQSRQPAEHQDVPAAQLHRAARPKPRFRARRCLDPPVPTNAGLANEARRPDARELAAAELRSQPDREPVARSEPQGVGARCLDPRGAHQAGQ